MRKSPSEHSLDHAVGGDAAWPNLASARSDASASISPASRQLARDGFSLFSHDLRAICRHIEIFSEMLADDETATENAGARRPAPLSDGDCEAPEYLERIAERAAALRATVEGYATFFSPLFDDLCPERVDCIAIVDAAWRDATTSIDETSAAIRFENAVPVGTAVIVDQAMTTKIFQRLFVNVFNHAGGAASHVRVSARRNTDRIVFSVEDDGVGLPSHRLASVFEPGASTLTGGANRAGVGLGLPFCRLAVQRLGGAIDAVNAGSMQGARFDFDLPAA